MAETETKQEAPKSLLPGFTTTTGLKDDYTGTVEDARFTQDQSGKVLGGNVYLEWDVVPDDGDAPQSIKFSCGAGYVIVGNGKSVKHSEKANRGPNELSGIGVLLDRCVKHGVEASMVPADATAEAPTGIVKALAEKSWADASVWKGLRFHFSLLRKSYVDKVTGEKKESTNTLPDAFLGTAAAPAATAPKTPKPTPAATTAAATTPPANGNGAAAATATADASLINGLGLTPVQVAKIKIAAKGAAGNQTAFEDAAFLITDVATNNLAAEAIVDGTLLASLS